MLYHHPRNVLEGDRPYRFLLSGASALLGRDVFQSPQVLSPGLLESIQTLEHAFLVVAPLTSDPVSIEVGKRRRFFLN
jgi:hypothetical protein